MKRIITRFWALSMLILIVSIKMSAIAPYSGSFPITLQAFTQLYTTPLADGWLSTTSAPSSTARTTCFTQNDGNFNSGRNVTYQVPRCGTITIKANNSNAGRGLIVTVTDVTTSTQLSRTSFLITSCTEQVITVNNNAITNITLLSPTTSTSSPAPITAFGSVYLSYLNITDYTPAAPIISSFVAEGVSATVNHDAGTITAQLPYGTNLATVTPVVTVGGTATGYTPSGAQDFSAGPVNYTASDGVTNKVYAVTLTVPATPPAPVITLSSGASTQGVKPGNAITNIVYNMSNTTGANVTGLPTGISGNYASTGTYSGTYTISGTVDGGATPALNNYTLTATAIPGYVGSDVTASGKLVVKSPTAKSICYLVATATQSANDTKLYPYLNEGTDYMVTLRQAASTAPASTVYDSFDLIILNEIISSSNAELVAIKAIDKPILSLKSFVYNSGSGRWTWGTADNGIANNGTVTVKQASHPVFSGLTLNAGTLDILTGAVGNGIQPVDVTTLSGRSIVVASAPKTTGTHAVAIHDVPATIRSVVNSKFLLIPVSDINYNKFTNDGLALINNAISYLLTGTQETAPSLDISSMSVSVNDVPAYNVSQPDASSFLAVMPIGTVLTSVTPVFTLAGTGTSISPATAQDFSNSQVTPLVYTVSDMISTKQYNVVVRESTTGINDSKLNNIYLDGNIIRNINAEMINMFDYSGKLLLTTNQDINLSNQAKGIYIIKGISGVIKIALTK